MFFEVNGQPRTVTSRTAAMAANGRANKKADESDPGQIGAPMPGMIVGISVQPGQKVEKGDALFTIEAMKMETAVYAQTDGKVAEIVLSPGTRVEQHDLVIQMEAGG